VRTAPLDEYVDRLPREGALIIVCSSYNGTPPDNAAKFCAWLDQAAEGAARDVRYAVFGCGNREWAATYQAVPSRIDARLEALGGIRIAPLGAADANDDFDGDFERWDHELWPQLNAALGLEASPLEAGEGLQLDMEVLEDHHPSPFAASFGARPMTVVANDELHIKTGVHGSERSTRHIEVALPEGVTYAAGDHLGVIPQNDPETVKRVAKRFGLLPETRIRLRVKGRGETSLPVDQIVSVGRVLTEYVELGEVATRRQITRMSEHTECPPEKQRLLALCGEDDAAYRSDVLARSKSLVDLLEDFPGCAMPFDVYLAQLSPLKPRYYSISSSPLHTERICSVTVGVVEGPARCGRGRFRGACSNYLARTPRGKSVYAFVRDTRSSFRMPGPATPMIMVGPGTGLAPFRGFVQERAAMRRNGDTVGRSLLFFGCRHPEQDYLYREELEEYAKEGVITLHVAFSRVEDRAYVQDLIRREKDEVWALLEQGAGVYVCGDASRMAPDVRAAFVEICREKSGRPQAEAEAWVAELEASHRYLTDVWAAGSPVGS
jgi:cytochrome P450/NADPH-cytochrome P450 reductase